MPIYKVADPEDENSLPWNWYALAFPLEWYDEGAGVERPANYRYEVTVIDQAGRPLPGAKSTLFGRDTTRYEGMTNGSGVDAWNAPPGGYELAAAKQRYQDEAVKAPVEANSGIKVVLKQVVNETPVAPVTPIRPTMTRLPLHPGTARLVVAVTDTHVPSWLAYPLLLALPVALVVYIIMRWLIMPWLNWD